MPEPLLAGVPPAGGQRLLRRAARRRGAIAWMLIGLPALYFVLLFAWPLGTVIRMAFSRPVPDRVSGVGFSAVNFVRIFTNPFYLETLWVTLRIGLLVALFALLLGYPLAWFLSRTRSRLRGLLLFLTLAPILISVVVRAYGWIVLLSPRGLVNSLLLHLGLIDRPIRLIFNQTGIIIGTTHVLLPFMVLAIMGSLQTLDRSLEDAAASLGARPWQVFRDIVLPLSLPGVAAGVLLVFVLAVSSFVTPVLLGGQLVLTIPILALQQFTQVFDWSFGSALVTVLLAAVIGISLAYDRLLRNRLSRGVR